jgi:uncharacterized membrane protein YqiK
MTTLDSTNLLPWLVSFVGVVLFLIMLIPFKGYRLLGIAVIPDDSIGVLTKKFGIFGQIRLPDGRVIALNKEAGFQADTLAPGLYFGYWPWQFSIEIVEFITVPQSKVGIAEARDGVPIPTGRVLAQHTECNSFQDARAFLSNGGQRGPQLDVIPPGTYRINTALFQVTIVDALLIPQGKVGIVTTLEGEPLATNEIAGGIVVGHQSFQNANQFIEAGGMKGLQEQVLLAGMYYLNPLFAHIELIDLIDIPIGYVGVVVSFVGARGQDTSGTEFTHGNIVSPGQKGVWKDPLDPGRYPINLRTMRVEQVPTTNIVLNWATGKSEAHQLDKNLSTITVRSGDGFTFNLDVSQIIHVSRENAPKVIARFGTMVNLVTQVLEPTIGNYFRNSAQSSDVIEFLRGRAGRQQQAASFITDALTKYNVQAVDTLIGDITPPEKLMDTLTDRKVAEQRKITFETQEAAEKQRQDFERARSEADTRGQVVQASRAAEVAKLNADAAINAATGEAGAKTINAEADAKVILVTGEASARKTQLVGDAEAGVLKKKVDAVGAPYYALMNVVDQLSLAKTALVPQIQVQGGGDRDGRPTLVDAFIGNLLAQNMKGPDKDTNTMK